jgi:hypothetical protein
VKAPLWLVLAALAIPSHPLAAQSSSSRVIECGTDSRQRSHCVAGGEIVSARLVQDLSFGRCGPAGTWGWHGDTLWADNACRGRFEVRYPSAADTLASRRITCGTLTSRRHECSTEGRADSVTLVRRTTFARCTKGSNWGHSDSLIWAGQGCRAEFEVFYRRTPVKPRPGPARPVTRTISCGKATGELQTCRTEGYVDTVRILRDLSGRTCRQKANWDYSHIFIWTRDGCRGDFEVTYRDTISAATRRIICGNTSGAQVTCRTEGHAAEVRLVRDLSGNRCREGSSWGHTDSFIWAGRGCRAEFEVSYRSAAPTRADVRRITCGSASAIRVQCRVGDATDIRVVRNVGSNECRRGSNWQYADRTITAGNGCRAEFEMTVRGGADTTVGLKPVAPATRVVSCGDASGSAMACNAFGTVATVRVLRDRSAGRCSQPSSWGINDQTIWVARGCYGDFELTYPPR